MMKYFLKITSAKITFIVNLETGLGVGMNLDHGKTFIVGWNR